MLDAADVAGRKSAARGDFSQSPALRLAEFIEGHQAGLRSRNNCYCCDVIKYCCIGIVNSFYKILLENRWQVALASRVMLDFETLKKRIQTARIEKGIRSDKALLEQAGVYKGAFSDWFNKDPKKRKTADTASLEKIALALGVPVSRLMDDANASPTEKPPMNLNAEVWLEIKGKIFATPNRLSIQAAAGKFIKGLPGEQGCYALIVEGDSMVPAYVPGDVIVVRPKAITLTPFSEQGDEGVYVPYEQLAPLNNRDCILTHDSNVMLKRIQLVKTKGPMYDLFMYSLNKEYAKIKVRFGDELHVQAIVVRTYKEELPE